MIISCVLKKSLAFGPEHVEWLGRQVAEMYPKAVFRPFTDVPVNIPHERLEGSLPTWWAKMEAYRRMPEGTVMMVDLDTVLLKPVDIPEPKDGLAYMQTNPRDVQKVWGGLMISSPLFRRNVTDHFYVNAQERMDMCYGCDQRYYAANWLPLIRPLNVVSPDTVVSYKLHYLTHGFRPDNAIVLFHGLPRPWQVAETWIPPLFPPSE